MRDTLALSYRRTRIRAVVELVYFHIDQEGLWDSRTDLDTSQSSLQSAAIPLCVGASAGGAVVLGVSAVRVVGVPGIPTHRYCWSTIPPQSVPMVGFHFIKSSFENLPNISTICSHVSDVSTWYHALQVPICPCGNEDGRWVVVGGAGKVSPAATQ